MESKTVKGSCMKPIASPSPDGLAPNGAVLPSTQHCERGPSMLSAKISGY